MTTQTLLEVDSRRRISLGALVAVHDRYLATVEDDGVIILTPAAVVTLTELAALQDPGVMEAVRQAKAGDRASIRRREVPEP
jgi:hypothetical protein